MMNIVSISDVRLRKECLSLPMGDQALMFYDSLRSSLLRTKILEDRLLETMEENKSYRELLGMQYE